MRQRYPRDRRIDLLKADESRRYAANPERLREEVEAEGPGPGGRIVIDEVQKVPALLDEAHWLLENRGLRFALCGSSARKVRRGAANPLGGRAVRYELHGLTADELADGFDLSRMLNHGYLPRMYQALRPARLLDACIADYLKEEVAAEGLVRNLPDFSDFLHAAALSDAEIINFSNVANDCAVSSHTAKAYFQILEDTRLGRCLPRLPEAPETAAHPGAQVPSRRRRGREPAGPEGGRWLPAPTSTERRSRIGCSTSSRRSAPTGSPTAREPDGELSCWRLAGGTQVDFVLGDMRLAVEAKASARISGSRLKGLRALADEHPGVGRRVVACLGPRARRTDDRIDVLHAPDFVRRRRSGSLPSVLRFGAAVLRPGTRPLVTDEARRGQDRGGGRGRRLGGAAAREVRRCRQIVHADRLSCGTLPDHQGIRATSMVHHHVLRRERETRLDPRAGAGRGPGPPRVEKPALVRHLGAVDTDALRAHVGRLSEKVWWQEDATKENDYFCFTHTRHIVFRFIHGNRTPLRYYSRPIWRIWQRWLLPVMARAAAPYGYTEPVYPKAMLARLAAGCGIDTHVDGGGSHPLTHRIHVPLQTNPRATLTVNGTDFHLEYGHAFEVNNLVPHGVFNGGEEDRIHFIFEVFEGAFHRGG